MLRVEVATFTQGYAVSVGNLRTHALARLVRNVSRLDFTAAIGIASAARAHSTAKPLLEGFRDFPVRPGRILSARFECDAAKHQTPLRLYRRAVR
jgi:hypothetical protein